MYIKTNFNIWQGDTHSGYGPNLFLNLIKQNKKIEVFGNGAEKTIFIFLML